MIAVVQGGHDSEAEVSRMTSKSFQAALSELGHQYKVVEYDDGFKKTILSMKPDLCLLALHGKNGEDGVVQALLEELKIPYTGSGVEASRLAFNKALSIQKAGAYGVSVLPHFLCRKNEIVNQEIIDEVASWEEGFVVKPVESGSSRGVSLCERVEELEEAIKEALRWDSRAMIEKRVRGRELTVALFEGEAFEPIEIRPKTGFYDMENKYTKGATDYLIPAPISEELKQTCQNAALKIFKNFNLKTYSRVDFLINNRGDQYYFMEVNTLPGCTETSLVPKALAHAGIPFTKLIESLVVSASLES